LNNKEKWSNFFPYTKPRIEQERSINSIINSLSNNKKYIIVDCGTGIGKSAIGLTLAKYINSDKSLTGNFQEGSYFLTTQKILQDQYEKDFSNKGLISLYSSKNYTCKRDKNSISCKEIQTSIRTSNQNKTYKECSYDCIYKKKRKSFIEEDLSITNFSFFLTEKNYSKKFPNKKVLVIDEAHNLENELTRFIEINVSEFFSEKILKLKIPKEIKTQGQVFRWIKNEYLKKVTDKINFVSIQLEKLGITTRKLEEFKKITNHYDMLVAHQQKINRFVEIYDSDNWIFDIEKNDKYKKFIFKPVDVSSYAKQYMFDYADYVIFMSATVISQESFSISLGLPYENTIYIKESSPFPKENRPVVFCPAGSMSYKCIDKTLPVMSEMISKIMENHSKQKGIIHTHSLKIANYLVKSIKSKRLILAYGENREKMLQKHINSKDNTVLVSPSMAEGVDLKGKLSEFQVICKVPFPFLGDKAVKKKMNKWKWWYSTQTLRTIIQSIGRSIRSENDSAVTYILDQDWSRVKSYAKNNTTSEIFDNYSEF